MKVNNAFEVVSEGECGRTIDLRVAPKNVISCNSEVIIKVGRDYPNAL